MKNYQNKTWLKYQYEELGKYQYEIAKEENVSQSTIWKWMKRFGIESRKKGGGHWKGGETISSEGYRFIYKSNHPYSRHNGYIKQARLRMEKEMGRYLTPQEVVHHQDLDKLNDNIENLQIMSKSEHSKLHNKIRGFLKGLEEC